MSRPKAMALDRIDERALETFYRPLHHRPRPAPAKPRPTHYKIVCISLYTEDLDRLDAAVRDLKRKGHTKASRSSVLRAAMMQLDLTKIPRGL